MGWAGQFLPYRRTACRMGGCSRPPSAHKIVAILELSYSTQGLIAYHLKERYGVGSVFFKTYRNKFYVDSAECKRCGSTVIEFDIELSDEVLAQVSKLAGKPIEKLRSEIQGLAERIAENNRNDEQDAPADLPDHRSSEL